MKGYDTKSGVSLPVVRPFFPLLAWTLSGVWIGWPWFIFNAFAVGSDRKASLLKTIGVGLLGASVISWILVALFEPDASFDVSLFSLLNDDDERHPAIPYVITALIAWKLTISYRLVIHQGRDVEIYEYYGGTPRNGMVVVGASVFLRSWVLLKLLPVGWWTLVLA